VIIVRMLHGKDQGFTLVELMVVVLIIGILVALAIPVFNVASEAASENTCHSNMRTIEGAVEQWLSSDPQLVRDDCGAAGGTGWRALLIPGYIKAEPRCPGGPEGYTYFTSGVPTPTVGSVVCNTPSAHPHY
jgi:type IV pilus assembly protein PilA